MSDATTLSTDVEDDVESVATRFVARYAPREAAEVVQSRFAQGSLQKLAEAVRPTRLLGLPHGRTLLLDRRCVRHSVSGVRPHPAECRTERRGGGIL